MIECGAKHGCGNMTLYMFQIPVCQKIIWSQDRHPQFLIDVWSLIGEPTTEMDSTDWARVKGLRPWVEECDGLRLNGLRWRPLFKEPVWLSECKTRWKQSEIEEKMTLHQYKAGCRQHIDIVTGLARIYDVCNRWDKKNKKKWTKNRALTPVSMVVTWGRINFNKRWARKQIWLPRDDKTREKMYVQACEGAWCGQEYMLQTYLQIFRMARC